MMRALLCGCLVFAQLQTADRPSAQNAGAAATPAELPETWLEGNIGGHAVRMYIDTAGWPKSNGLWGAYYYTRYQQPIPLDGDQLPDGTIRMYEGDPGELREGGLAAPRNTS